MDRELNAAVKQLDGMSGAVERDETLTGELSIRVRPLPYRFVIELTAQFIVLKGEIIGVLLGPKALLVAVVEAGNGIGRGVVDDLHVAGLLVGGGVSWVCGQLSFCHGHSPFSLKLGVGALRLRIPPFPPVLS